MNNVHDLGAALDNVRTVYVSADSGELDLAEYVREQIGPENMHVDDGGVYLWSGTIWDQVTAAHWKHKVQQMLKQIPGIKLTDRKVSSVANLAKTDSYTPDFEWPHDDGEAVACLNGVAEFDGNRWSLREHQREDYRTSVIPVEFHDDADSPRFVQFLREVFEGDPDAADKATATMEMVGYTLMRHNRHERFVIVVGTGSNGKSVLLDMLGRLCGTENVAAVQPDQLDRPFQRASLYRKLANIITELRQGEQIRDAALKSLVSGEITTVEQKFGHPFQMKPYATQWYATNHMPHTRDFSYALFRRAVVIPFNRRFEGAEVDRNLTQKLVEELPGILRLALGCYGEALKRGEFTEPQSCIEAKDAWRLEADQVHRWATEGLEHKPGGFVSIKHAYERYLDWAKDQGIHKTVGKHEFTSRVERLGFELGRSNKGRTIKNVQECIL